MRVWADKTKQAVANFPKWVFTREEWGQECAWSSLSWCWYKLMNLTMLVLICEKPKEWRRRGYTKEEKREWVETCNGGRASTEWELLTKLRVYRQKGPEGSYLKTVRAPVLSWVLSKIMLYIVPFATECSRIKSLSSLAPLPHPSFFLFLLFSHSLFNLSIWLHFQLIRVKILLNPKYIWWELKWVSI